jgi:hypothetical protein
MSTLQHFASMSSIVEHLRRDPWRPCFYRTVIELSLTSPHLLCNVQGMDSVLKPFLTGVDGMEGADGLINDIIFGAEVRGAKLLETGRVKVSQRQEGEGG